MLRGQIVVVGGLTAEESPSARADACSPATGRWRRLPGRPPPSTIHSSRRTAAVTCRRLRRPARARRPATNRVRFDAARWRRPSAACREPRAAGGAAVVGGRLYVVGGVGATGLARRAFALDLDSRRWSVVPAPTPREHLAVTWAGGRSTPRRAEGRLRHQRRHLRELGARQRSGGGGSSTSPDRARHRRRGGRRPLVSVGGEEPAGTIASVYAWDLGRGGWRRLPDLRTPRTASASSRSEPGSTRSAAGRRRAWPSAAPTSIST